MREYKFDVILWDGEDKKTISHYNIEEAIGEGLIDFEDGVMKSVDSSVIIRQFTGLYDDNGKEICEDDIVEVWNKTETKTTYISKVYKSTHNGISIDAHPVHDKLGLGYKRKLFEFCDYGIGGNYNVSCKLLGNIYENPELLKTRMGI